MIDKWLKAGVMEQGRLGYQDEVTPPALSPQRRGWVRGGLSHGSLPWRFGGLAMGLMLPTMIIGGLPDDAEGGRQPRQDVILPDNGELDQRSPQGEILSDESEGGSTSTARSSDSASGGVSGN